MPCPRRFTWVGLRGLNPVTCIDTQHVVYAHRRARIGTQHIAADSSPDSELNPTQCTRVYLSDGSTVFAVSKYDTFKKNFIENYLPLFNSTQTSVQNQITD